METSEAWDEVSMKCITNHDFEWDKRIENCWTVDVVVITSATSLPIKMITANIRVEKFYWFDRNRKKKHKHTRH